MFCSTFGLGFPAFRGGLVRYANKVGIAKIMGRLRCFSEMVGERYNGLRYRWLEGRSLAHKMDNAQS